MSSQSATKRVDRTDDHRCKQGMKSVEIDEVTATVIQNTAEQMLDTVIAVVADLGARRGFTDEQKATMVMSVLDFVVALAISHHIKPDHWDMAIKGHSQNLSRALSSVEGDGDAFEGPRYTVN